MNLAKEFSFDKGNKFKNKINHAKSLVFGAFSDVVLRWKQQAFGTAFTPLQKYSGSVWSRGKFLSFRFGALVASWSGGMRRKAFNWHEKQTVKSEIIPKEFHHKLAQIKILPPSILLIISK